MVISERHRQAAKLLQNPAISKQQVAFEVGVAPGTLSRWLKDEDFTLLVDSFAKRVAARRTTEATTDLDTLHRLCMTRARKMLEDDSLNPSVHASLIKDVFSKTIPNRSPVDGAGKTEGEHIAVGMRKVVEVTRSDADGAGERLMQQAQGAQEVV